MDRLQSSRWQWLALAVVAASVVVVGGSRVLGEESREVEFTDVRKQTEEFIGYYETIKLTSQQESIKREALSNLPAPCCANNSAYTCCCVCNLSRTIWGLSNHLIAERGFDAEGVRGAVIKWANFINPDGFSGNGCHTGGCGRAFAKNGCGGMNASQVVW